jgi:hypothetical protein
MVTGQEAAVVFVRALEVGKGVFAGIAGDEDAVSVGIIGDGN